MYADKPLYNGSINFVGEDMPKIACVNRFGRCQTPFFEQQFLKAFYDRFLSKAQPLKSGSVIFDFNELVWADLLEILSIIGAMFHLSTQSNQKVALHISESAKSQKSIDHLAASGFFSLLSHLSIEVNAPEVTTDDPHFFFRFTNITDYYKKEEARNLILENLKYYYPEMSSTERFSFDKIVNEALENTLEHAYDSRPSGLRPRLIGIRRFPAKSLAAQSTQILTHQSYWLRDLLRHSKGCDFLEISIVDVGVGILANIRNELVPYMQSKLGRAVMPSEINDLSALRFVTSKAKSTSSYSKEGKGFGLYKLKNHVQAWNGLFLIRSGRARIISSPATQENDETDKLIPFLGTQIRVLLPVTTDRRMNIEYILSRESELK
ncbi:MAG TPA: hypothetical protein VFQ47_01350 [Nitrososphaera sp.]|nr:hypothetical protein [Nitrososphaera sp.]